MTRRASKGADSGDEWRLVIPWSWHGGLLHLISSKWILILNYAGTLVWQLYNGFFQFSLRIISRGSGGGGLRGCLFALLSRDRALYRLERWWKTWALSELECKISGRFRSVISYCGIWDWFFHVCQYPRLCIVVVNMVCLPIDGYLAAPGSAHHYGGLGAWCLGL